METEVTAKQGHVSERQARVTRSLQLQATYAKFREESQRLQMELDELKRALPQDKETADLLNQVQASARNAGLSIHRMVWRPIIDHEVYFEVPVEMEVLGTYHSLGGFLERIRQLDRIVSINKLRLENRASTGQNAYTTSVGATYEATTFVYREEIAEEAPAAQAVPQ
jgi:type IV pilus assembly protein PilO